MAAVGTLAAALTGAAWYLSTGEVPTALGWAFFALFHNVVAQLLLPTEPGRSRWAPLRAGEWVRIRAVGRAPGRRRLRRGVLDVELSAADPIVWRRHRLLLGPGKAVALAVPLALAEERDGRPATKRSAARRIIAVDTAAGRWEFAVARHEADMLLYALDPSR
ncbi:hypothetical protein [Streptomonospora sp. PA3]|uniref:hypothetical protein n=1 Tax=Streptomonospora sp. PA3 TaxID=2607326 RepID=UPI001642D202|nr:hypothetical protein [Streptomonospora sp. PA3]